MNLKKRYISVIKNEIIKELNKDYLVNKEYVSNPGFPNLIYLKNNKGIFLTLIRNYSYRSFFISYLNKIHSNLIISINMLQANI